MGELIMSAPPEGKGEPITGRDQLVAFLEAGCKPPEAWRIGTEHEKFVYTVEDSRPVPYGGERGIAAIFKAMERFGWQPVFEGDNAIAMTDGKAGITLEPGGQLELSGAPLETIHETCDEVHQHLDQCREVTEPLGVHMMGLGFNPKWPHEAIPKMPKQRYDIMTARMLAVGGIGIEMMYRTCTAQVNLDFVSEADMIKKFRVSLALQPLATALFANSPFKEGKPNGYLSYRAHVWSDTDPERSGNLPFVFEDGMGFERYVDYILDVPMYFVYRGGRYIDASGQSFRDFLAGRLPALPGEIPTTSDWTDHLTTAFPDVRMKQFLEMRGADGGPWDGLCALPAFWVGLLYDQGALDAAWDLVKDWTADDRAALGREVPVSALRTTFKGQSLKELAREVVAISDAGLKCRARLDSKGRDESHFLDVLKQRAETGKCPADYLLEDYEERWRGDIDRIFVECAY
jgi:glutamate--cysteine ligase